MLSCGCPHFSLGKKCLSPLSAAWRRQVPIESVGQEPYNHSFFNRKLSQGVSDRPTRLPQWLYCVYCGFLPPGPHCESSISRKMEAQEAMVALERFTLIHLFTVTSYITCLSRPVTSLQMKAWRWTKGWLSPWLRCSACCLVVYPFAVSHHSFCRLWGRTCHFVLELLWQVLVQDEGC